MPGIWEMLASSAPQVQSRGQQLAEQQLQRVQMAPQGSDDQIEAVRALEEGLAKSDRFKLAEQKKMLDVQKKMIEIQELRAKQKTEGA